MSAGQVLTAATYNNDVHTGSRLLDEQSLDAQTTSVSFNNIDQSFKTLWIIATGGVTGTIGREIEVQCNGDTGTNYREMSWNWFGDGTTSSFHNTGNSSTHIGRWGYNARQNGFSALVYRYTRTDQEKPMQSENIVFDSTTAADARFSKHAGVWQSTAAITDIKLMPAGGESFVVGSLFQLYGLGT